MLWFTFFFGSFVLMIVGIYFSKDKIWERTEVMPVLNHTRYHNDAVIEDSTYTEKVDSLSVVVNGLLGQLSQYVTQLKERDNSLHLKNRELNKLKQENEILKKQIQQGDEKKEEFNREQNELRLQELAKTIGDMRVEVLRPILTGMPDNVIQILYDKAKSKDKSKIFNAMDANRAAKIMSDIAQKSTREN
jgi:flagellar motility protein MotE (MotC chaperone)